MNTPKRVVVTDANILINLCHAGLLVLLEQLPGYEFVIPGEVDAEVTDPEQRRMVDELFARGKVERQSLASVGELAIYAELAAERRDEIERAYAAIAPMFWGERISLEDALTTIRGWCGGALR